MLYNTKTQLMTSKQIWKPEVDFLTNQISNWFGALFNISAYSSEHMFKEFFFLLAFKKRATTFDHYMQIETENESERENNKNYARFIH